MHRKSLIFNVYQRFMPKVHKGFIHQMGDEVIESGLLRFLLKLWMLKQNKLHKIQLVLHLIEIH